MINTFKYDYLIVGGGLFGCTFANYVKQFGKTCLIIDKRNHIAGNIYTENIHGINVHKYGPHIFHTSNKKIWDYVNRFVSFNGYIHQPIANFNGEIYNLPFNMNTFNKIWGVKTPEEARLKINSQIINIESPKNLEEFALSKVGKDIYEKLIYGYTYKQWNTDPKNLPVSILARIPIRFTYDNNYFNDIYQGIPIGGYTELIKAMIDKIDVQLNTDYFKNRNLDTIAKKIVFSGKIDEFFNFKYGKLAYRSLKFIEEIIDSSNYQGVSICNYTSKDIEFTRITEHNHFEFTYNNKTIITKEYPCNYDESNEPFYPINNNENNLIYEKYKLESLNLNKYIFGGRLGSYKYYDMHQVIGQAISTAKKEIQND